MITFQREALRDVRAEVEPLLVRHWHEIALNKDTVPLDPNWDMYFRAEDAGHVCAITARCDGELVGYVNYIIVPNLHYRSLLVADGDIFWLAPEHRKGLIGMKMLRHAEVVLLRLGVNKIVNKVKLHFDIGVLFERMGYTPIERIYAKKLG
jgi:GNAT superfamily N-acetyltransferase